MNGRVLLQVLKIIAITVPVTWYWLESGRVAYGRLFVQLALPIYGFLGMTDGRLKTAIRPDDIPVGVFDLWAANVIVSLLPAVVSGEESALNCVVARFDVAAIKKYLGVDCAPVYCTKIASKLVRTYTDRHGLKDLTRELLGIKVSKEQQSSNWGSDELTPEQLKYAATDVLHLHQLRVKLDKMLARENRQALAQASFDFLTTRVALDLQGWNDIDIFHH